MYTNNKYFLKYKKYITLFYAIKMLETITQISIWFTIKMQRLAWYIFIYSAIYYFIYFKNFFLYIVKTVLVNLTQLVWIMHNICKVRNLNSSHHTKKLELQPYKKNLDYIEDCNS